MFCRKCGIQVSEESNFCIACGEKILSLPKKDVVDDNKLDEIPDIHLKQNDDFRADMHTDGTNVKSEVIVHGHSSKSKVKAKVYCNNNYVGTVGKDESIVVPISTDSLIEFKQTFHKLHFPVKVNELTEIKLEISTLTGNIHAFDLHSLDSLEKIERMKKRNKILRPLLIIFVILLFLKDGLMLMFRSPNVLESDSRIDTNSKYSEDLNLMVNEIPHEDTEISINSIVNMDSEVSTNDISYEDSESTDLMILTEDEAYEIVNAWLYSYPFPYDVYIDPDSYSDESQEFICFELHWDAPPSKVITDIYVNKKTGEMFSYELGLSPEPLDQWYNTYYTNGTSQLVQEENTQTQGIILLPDAEIKKLNIFLSNFIEASLWEYTDLTRNGDLINFAYIHNYINNPSQFSLEEIEGNYYEVIDGSYIADTINRFFNRDIPLFSFDYYIYQNDKLYCPAADGGFYGYLAQVNIVEDYLDGTYGVCFDIYEMEYGFDLYEALYEPVSGWNEEMLTHAWPNGAASHAVVRMVTLNDVETYQLESISPKID